jgi:hypothetical protein
VASALIRGWILYAAADLAHAVDVSNLISLASIGVLIATGAVLIQPARKIIEELLGRG